MARIFPSQTTTQVRFDGEKNNLKYSISRNIFFHMVNKFIVFSGNFSVVHKKRKIIKGIFFASPFIFSFIRHLFFFVNNCYYHDDHYVIESLLEIETYIHTHHHERSRL